MEMKAEHLQTLKKIGVKLDRLEVDVYQDKTTWSLWSDSVDTDKYHSRTKGTICLADVTAIAKEAMAEFLYENKIGGEWGRSNDPEKPLWRITIVDRRNNKRYAIIEGDTKYIVYYHTCMAVEEAKQMTRQANKDWFESLDLNEDGNEKK